MQCPEPRHVWEEPFLPNRSIYRRERWGEGEKVKVRGVVCRCQVLARNCLPGMSSSSMPAMAASPREEKRGSEKVQPCLPVPGAGQEKEMGEPLILLQQKRVWQGSKIEQRSLPVPAWRKSQLKAMPHHCPARPPAKREGLSCGGAFPCAERQVRGGGRSLVGRLLYEEWRQAVFHENMPMLWERGSRCASAM